MDPSSTVVGVPVAAAIHGRSFWLKTNANFGTRDLTVDASFTAQLANTLLEPVEYVSGKQLTTHVPSTLEVGSYDLTVVDPAGRVGVLPGAFTVLPDSTQNGDSDTPPGDALAGDETSVCVDSCVCDNDATCNLACPGGGCDLLCNNDATCNLACPGGGCDFVCDNDARCDGACGQDCIAECKGSASCDLSCGTGCTFSCVGNTDCSFDCQSGCSAECVGSAKCVLSCANPIGCSIDCGNEDTVDCGGGVLACQAPCP